MKKLLFTLLSSLIILVHSASAQSFSYVDIFSGGGNSNPYGMTAFNGKVYFSAQSDTTTTGAELWVSDGTQAGTSLLKDIWPGPGSSNPGGFIAVGNRLFFTANDSIHGEELWATDGTSAGTVMVADIWQGPGSSYAGTLTPMGGKLYFSADDSIHGYELWVSDGTTAGTSIVKDINPGSTGSGIYGVGPGLGANTYTFQMTELNNKLYFGANDNIHGDELWVTDGTTAGTVMVADIWAGPGSSSPFDITAYNGKLILSASDSIHGTELWVSDGTPAGTSLLKDIDPGMNSSSPGDWEAYNLFNGKLYFDAYTDASGNELWVTDGTTGGTTMVKDILPGPGSSIDFGRGLHALNNLMYFSATDSVNGAQLWVSDGTAAGTTLLKVLSNLTPYDATPTAFIPYNGQMVFIASVDTTNMEQLFISDGTAGGTHTLSPPIAPNTNPMNYEVSFYDKFCILNNSLFMAGDFNSIGNELWIYGFPAGITPIGGEQIISAYPNPFSSTVTISGLESSGQYSVQLVDLTGREFYNTTINDPSQNVSVTMPELSAGVYLMRISGQGTAQTFKMVKN